MNNRRANRLIIILLITGIIITGAVQLTVRSSVRKISSDAATQAVDIPAGTSEYEENTYAEFLNKFREVDASIAKMKEESKKDSSGISEKNAVSAELRYWETQLNSLYNTILSNLTSEEKAVLAKDEQEWEKTKDSVSASAASRSSGASSEILAYTEAEASETRKRAYELLEKYRNELL